MPVTVECKSEAAFKAARENIQHGGLTIISEPHGFPHGFSFGARLIHECGRADNRTVFMEFPEEFEKEKSRDKLLKKMIEGAPKFDHKALEFMFDAACLNGWRIKCADSEYYQLIPNAAKEARQEGIAKRLIKGMKDANGGLFVVGGRHVTGVKMGRSGRTIGKPVKDGAERYGYWGIAQYIPGAEKEKIYKFSASSDYGHIGVSAKESGSRTLYSQCLKKLLFKT